jgi:hypothetical protein
MSWLLILLVIAAVVGIFQAILVDASELRRASRRRHG